MADLPFDLKRKIADIYLECRKGLESLNTKTMELFASELLQIVKQEKNRIGASHDLEVLEESMLHLKRDLALLGDREPESDDYAFALNDCKNLVNATEKWLSLEGLI